MVSKESSGKLDINSHCCLEPSMFPSCSLMASHLFIIGPFKHCFHLKTDEPCMQPVDKHLLDKVSRLGGTKGKIQCGCHLIGIAASWVQQVLLLSETENYNVRKSMELDIDSQGFSPYLPPSNSILPQVRLTLRVLLLLITHFLPITIALSISVNIY